MLVRGKITNWFIQPDHDDTWNDEDWSRARTLEARWIAKGLTEEERRRLLPCAVWRKKFPGILFHEDIMKRLRSVEQDE